MVLLNSLPEEYTFLQVLLYDEPTAGLDPIASTVVEDLIRSVHLKGESTTRRLGKIASYVVVTHQHSTIRRAVDRYFILPLILASLFDVLCFCISYLLNKQTPMSQIAFSV